MSRSHARSGKDPHEDAQQLLPWLLAGTLEGEELASVEDHVQSCPLCQADLAWERNLRAASPAAAPSIDPDRAFAKLLPRLEPPDARFGLVERFKRALAANDNTWLRTLAAAQLGIIAALAVLLLSPRDEANYRTLGAATQPQGNLVVVFDPRTPERELRRILKESGARVVDGPTVTDAYVLAVPAPRAANALRRLRSEPSVTLAQPLVDGSRP
jgi:hypothetical protein